MRRALFAVIGSAAVGLLVLGATPALACSGADHAEGQACACNHDKADKAHGDHKAHKGHKADPAKKKAVEQKAAPAQKKDEAPPAQGSVLRPVDEILSATCNCGGPADCTCKKGECKCKKCDKHHRGVQKTLLLEPLRGVPVRPELPADARYDATAGVFI